MLQKLKLLYRLLLIAAIPMLAVAYFAIHDIARLIERRHGDANVAELVNVSSVIGNLLHELQRERGLSAGYTMSKGAKFAGTLPEQRKMTDRRLAEMNASLERSAKAIAESPLADGLAGLRDDFGQLPETRAAIDRLDLPVSEIAKRYTAKIDHGLETLNELSSVGRSGDASRERSAFLLLLHAKESAGIERAMGAAGFTTGDFLDPFYRQFAARIAMQTNQLIKFREFASPIDIETLDKIEKSPAARSVEAMRDAAHRSINPNVPLRGSAENWWNASTQRIDAMKALEDLTAREIIEGAKHDLAEATFDLWRAIGVFVVIIAAMIVAIWLVTRSILRPVRQVIHTMGEMGAGRLDGQTKLPEGNTELGALGDSVRAFRGQLAQVEAARAAQEREKEVQVTMIAGSIGAGLTALARGDLTHRIAADLEGPLAVLKTDFNAAIESLEQLIGAAIESVSNIRSGSTEIAQASEDLARRTERNAATLEQTTAAVAGLNQRVGETSSAAHAMLENTQTAGREVEEGRAIAGEAARSMRGVADSAEGIDSVIEGLDKIAFQTRVLAMNAAVEAGRAGEAGRGFAVVADLVSALAMRAEEEAKQARDQLTATQGEIGRAVGAVDRMDNALDSILGKMGDVQRLVQNIAGANQEQAGVLTEISAAMQDMDVSTQKNAAMVEQTSAAARNLMTEAGSLAEHTDAFETGATSGHSPAPRHSAPGEMRAAA